MKRVLVGTVLALSAMYASAEADIVATIVNKAGGHIYLYDKACSGDESGRIVVAVAGDGTALFGCAHLLNHEQIIVKYANGAIRMYGVDDFQWRKK